MELNKEGVEESAQVEEKINQLSAWYSSVQVITIMYLFLPHILCSYFFKDFLNWGIRFYIYILLLNF